MDTAVRVFLDILRFATLPFSLGFVWLVYVLGRAIGLRRDLACFGALTVGTSPLFLPLAASFMTEAYACFFTTLCIYAAIRSAEATRSQSATFWLWVLALSGIVGGSDRQTIWVAPLALIPYLFWHRRSDRAFSAHAAATYVVCLGLLALLATHFKPPYALFALAGPELRDAIGRQSAAGFGRLISLFLSCVMLALPGLLCFIRLWKRLGGLEICLLVVGSVAVVFVLIYATGVLGIAPYIGGILSQYGIGPRAQDALGYRPVLLNTTLRIILSVLVVFNGLALYLLCNTAPKNTLGTYRSVFLAFYAVRGATSTRLVDEFGLRPIRFADTSASDPIYFEPLSAHGPPRPTGSSVGHSPDFRRLRSSDYSRFQRVARARRCRRDRRTARNPEKPCFGGLGVRRVDATAPYGGIEGISVRRYFRMEL